MKIFIFSLLYLIKIINTNCDSSLTSLRKTIYISEARPTFRLLSKDSNPFNSMPNLYYGNRNEPLYLKCSIERYELICTFDKNDIANNLYKSYIITEIKENCTIINTKFTLMFVEDIPHCKKYDNEENICVECESLFKYDRRKEECKRNSTFKFLVIGIPIISAFIIVVVIIVIYFKKKNQSKVQTVMVF